MSGPLWNEMGCALAKKPENKFRAILEMDSVKSSANYPFCKGCYYYLKSQQGDVSEKRYYLEKSNEEYNLSLKQSVNKASAYNNLGINYQNLAQLAVTEEEKNKLLIQSENYFSKALGEAPHNPKLASQHKVYFTHLN